MPERKALMTTEPSALPLHIAAHEERAIPASPWLHIAAVHPEITVCPHAHGAHGLAGALGWHRARITPWHHRTTGQHAGNCRNQK